MKKLCDELKEGTPGQRFYACYRRGRTHRRESTTAKVFYLLLGAVALALGIVFSFSPFVPGFVFVLAGLVLLSARWAWMAKALDRSELVARRLWRQYWEGRDRSRQRR